MFCIRDNFESVCKYIVNTLLLGGRVSLKKRTQTRRSDAASAMAHRAGAEKNVTSPPEVRACVAKYAPIIGPMRKPNEKAIPIKA